MRETISWSRSILSKAFHWSQGQGELKVKLNLRDKTDPYFHNGSKIEISEEHWLKS